MKKSTTNLSKRLMLATCASAFAVIMPSTATAQLSGGTSADGFDEIVVTAQRREENVQDVPISITTFSGEALEKANITEAKDYLSFTPNVAFTEDGETGNRAVNISIRGVGDVDLGDISVANSIGYYIDELNVGTVASGVINPQLHDMAQIEILRGPQGTYFGRNSAGGALNISTRKPDENPYGSIEGQFGRFGTHGVTGVANIPLSDKFFFRGLASYEKSDGITKNINPVGVPNSGYENLHFRGAIRALLSDNVTVDLSVTHTDEDEGGDAAIPSGVLDLDTQSIFGAFNPVNTTGFYPDNIRFFDRDAQEFNRNDFTIINGRVEANLGSVTLKSITGLIDSNNGRFFDQDNIFSDTIVRENRKSGKSFSQELRLQSNNDGPLQWTVGGIYADDTIEQFNSIRSGATGSIIHPNTGLVTGLLPPIPAGFRINENERELTTKSFAVFADATYDLTDRFSVTAGARYTDDTVENRFFNVVAFEGTSADATGKQKFDDFSPRLALTFEASENLTTYASASKGYKAGGLDRLSTGTGVTTQAFNPEDLWNYEAGIKFISANNRFKLNAAAFLIDWNDLQVQTNFLLVPGDISSAVGLTQNAKGAKNKGFEVDAQAILADGFVISGGIGILDSEFDEFPVAILAGGNTVNLTGQRLPRTPSTTWNIAADYERSLGNDLDGFVRAELFGRSSSRSDLEAVAQPILGLPEFPYKTPSFAVANLRAGVTMNNVSLSGFIENVFEENYYTSTSENFGLSGIRIRPHPRIYGFKLKYEFGEKK